MTTLFISYGARSKRTFTAVVGGRWFLQGKVVVYPLSSPYTVIILLTLSQAKSSFASYYCCAVSAPPIKLRLVFSTGTSVGSTSETYCDMLSALVDIQPGPCRQARILHVELRLESLILA